MQLDASRIRFLNKDCWRCLSALENGMKNFEYVSKSTIVRLADLRNQGIHQILGNLMQHGLVAYEKTKNYEGYRLTWKGYDYLALHTFMKRGLIDAVGPRIGVGKEADVHIVCLKGVSFAMKIHRLGRTSFRCVLNKRNYLRKSQSKNGWLHLSAVSAMKEYQYLRALKTNQIPVPDAIDCNRHCVLMEYIDGSILNKYRELPLRCEQIGDNYSNSTVSEYYNHLMDLLVQLARSGVVHGDFNEFNIILTRKTKEIVLIDCPQVLPITHPSAPELFERDVLCIRTFFEKRFGYIGEKYPRFEEIVTDEVLQRAANIVSSFSKGNTIMDLREIETELYGGQYVSQSGDNNTGDSDNTDKDSNYDGESLLRSSDGINSMELIIDGEQELEPYPLPLDGTSQGLNVPEQEINNKQTCIK